MRYAVKGVARSVVLFMKLQPRCVKYSFSRSFMINCLLTDLYGIDSATNRFKHVCGFEHGLAPVVIKDGELFSVIEGRNPKGSQQIYCSATCSPGVLQ